MVIIKLIRPLNCLMTAIAVWVGAYLTEGYGLNLDVVLAALAASGVAAAAYIQNDILDFQIDLIAHPDRVLVSGLVPIRNAGIWAATTLAVGLVCAALVGPWAAITACVATVMLALYNSYLKRVPLIGNLTIGLVAALPFILGGLTVNSSKLLTLPGALVPATFAVLFHLVREIIKDIQDMSGDRAAGVITLPQLIGVRPAASIALLLFVLLDLQILVPVYQDWYSQTYTILAVAGVIVPLTASLIYTAVNPTVARLAWCSNALKVGMVIGMLALVLGRLP
jgi:4-hydroxybenzoate polyprenyltransferase